MKSKVYFEVINIFGKGDGDSILDCGLIDDTREERESLIEEYAWSDSFIFDKDKESFVSGKVDSLEFDLPGGDWDEPDYREINLYTYEQKLNIIETRYQNELKELNRLFNR